ncbi:MAG: stage II sporulation protein M, partial [Candidatus Thorarchaeota archaeon]|nr:stage II sporulation protein M [Candidatus Thorarchaeota archaeon]
YFAMDNLTIIDPMTWSILLFMIPLAMMILAGVLGHHFRKRIKGGLEGFAFWVGSLVTLAIWYIFPNMDFISDIAPTPTRFGGAFFYRLILLLYPPGAEDFVFRIANQLVIALPLFVSVTLFILYYLDFSDKWEDEQGIESSPLINIKSNDIRDTIVLFVGGLVASILGVIVLSLFISPYDLYWTMYGLISEIGNPDGLELVLAQSVSYFVIVAEHNIIRTFLMLVAGPLMWIAILWFATIQKKSKNERNIGISVLVLTAIAGVASFVWTIMDMNAGVFIPAQIEGDPFWPWTFAAQLGLRAGILFGILFGLYLLIFLVNRFGRGSAGGWWLPPLVTIFAIEYFVYDDQFTIIALIILPMILAVAYQFYETYLKGGKEPAVDTISNYPEDERDGETISNYPEDDSERSDERKQDDFLILYIKMGLLSLALAEVLSTALWVAGMGTALALAGGNGLVYVMSILPHGVIEIPAFLFAAAVALRIARDLGDDISDEKWDTLPDKAQTLLGDRKLWRTYLFIMFFLLLAALVEENITKWIVDIALHW